MAKTNEVNSGTEKVIQDPDLLREKLFQSEDFFKKNSKVILGVLLAVILAAGGFAFYKYRMSELDKEAQAELYKPVFYFESDSLDRALNGSVNPPSRGFLDIIDEYGGTDAADLSHFYAGAIYLKQGSYDEAINHLKDADLNDLLVQARAYALIGDAYMEKEDYSEAVSYYNKAADYKPNPFYTPEYMMKSALAYEQTGDYAKAIERYDGAIDMYNSLDNKFEWKRTSLSEAKKFRARAIALQGDK